jgi:hypothetical protein
MEASKVDGGKDEEHEVDDIKGDGSGSLLLQEKEGYIIQPTLFAFRGQWYSPLRGES